MLRGRTPLGWLQLTHSRGRFIMASAGVGFAVVLVFMQLGFMNMLFDTTVKLHKELLADVVLMSSESKGIPDTGTFSRRRLIQALGLPGVASGAGVSFETLGWTLPTDGSASAILVIGAPVGVQVFQDAALDRRVAGLRVAGSILLDELARGDFREFFAEIASGRRPRVEIAGAEVVTIGSFRFGASFALDAIAITSSDTFQLLAPSRGPGVLNLGLIRIKPGADPATVAHAIEAATGPDVVVMPMADFIALSRNRLAEDSPIATIFTFGSIIGLVVGAIIVVQILSSDVQDHLGEYATFKAMGFTNRYLLGVVYEQSAILTLTGYLPALGLSLLLYDVVGGAVDMAMTMPLRRIAYVLSLTAVMCAVAGSIAMRRLWTADPADVFS